MDKQIAKSLAQTPRYLFRARPFAMLRASSAALRLRFARLEGDKTSAKRLRARPFAAAQGFACGLPLRSRPQSGSNCQRTVYREA
jgi:hypothetical protein